MSAVIVPEHSRPLLEAISSGRSFELDGFVFVADGDWLMAIGYPLEGEFSESRFEAALEEAVRRVKPSDCFAIAPRMPEQLREHVEDRDVYYVLDASARVPSRLRGPVRHARERLTVDETREFTPEHRRLWAEFLSRIPLPPRIRQLYSGTAAALRGGADLRLLNAWDAEGQLAACLLLDYSLPQAVSYVLGAHSKTHYVPHAPDLLFAEMLERARAEGKQTILLGLGVNEGITRFKKKWGGVQSAPYELAVWQPAAGLTGKGGFLDMAAYLAISIGSSSSSYEMSRWKFFDSLPQQRPCAMLWRLDKNGRTSWIGGSAHFFCYSFEHSLRRLFENVDTVLLEGPIDSDSMDEVARIGRSPEPDAPRVAQFLSEEDIRRLERMVYGETCRRAAGAQHRRAPRACRKSAVVRVLLSLDVVSRAQRLDEFRGSRGMEHRARHGQVGHGHGKSGRADSLAGIGSHAAHREVHEGVLLLAEAHEKQLFEVSGGRSHGHDEHERRVSHPYGHHHQRA